MFLKEPIQKNAHGWKVLTQRDQLALQWISHQGMMTVDQLWKAVWGTDKTSNYTYKRVAFLTQAGFLEKVKTPYQKKHFFRNQKKAQDVLSTFGDSLVPKNQISLREIPHAYILTEVRLALLKSGNLLQWIPDRILQIDPVFPKQRFEVTVPDAIWITQETGSKIAIEFERTRKAKSRIRAKVEAYERELVRPDRFADLVLWIASYDTYKDLNPLLKNHPLQKLRTVEEFLEEMRN